MQDPDKDVLLEKIVSVFCSDEPWSGLANVDQLDGVVLESINAFYGKRPSEITVGCLEGFGLPHDMLGFLPDCGIAHFLRNMLEWILNEEEDLDDTSVSILTANYRMYEIKELVGSVKSQLVSDVLMWEANRMSGFYYEDPDQIREIERAAADWKLE